MNNDGFSYIEKASGVIGICESLDFLSFLPPPLFFLVLGGHLDCSLAFLVAIPFDSQLLVILQGDESISLFVGPIELFFINVKLILMFVFFVLNQLFPEVAVELFS